MRTTGHTLTPAAALALAAAAALFGAARRPSGGVSDAARTPPADSAAGAYLMVAGGCNDCHTPAWNGANGTTPDADRLTGSAVGWRGPWGTTYPANLRLLASRVSEDGWVQLLRTARGGTGRPPMPWMNTRQMPARDLRLMHRYLRRLGPAGGPAPAFVPPGAEPATPYILLTPQPPARPAPPVRRR